MGDHDQWILITLLWRSWIIDTPQLSQEGGELGGTLLSLMGDHDQWILVTAPLNIFNDGHSKSFLKL